MNRILHYFSIPGISKCASQEDVDSAYFKKVNELKPIPGLMKEDMTRVLTAYEILSDKDSREKYDQSFGSSDDIEEIVRNVTQQPGVEARGMFESQGVKKPGGHDDSMDANMIHWAYKVVLTMFLIITVPKVAYLAYVYLVDGVKPF